MKLSCYGYYFAFTLFILIQGLDVFAQGYWMQRAGGLNQDEGNDISIDLAGNTYTTGYFFNSADFGGSTVLSSSGATDIFLSRNNVAGDFAWAVKAGGSGADRGLSIKTDASGNSYITGYFFGTAFFGSSSVTSSGGQDVFIAKYDNAGNLVWVKSAGGTLSDIGNAITIDNAGNVVITGEFSGSATFGSFSLTSMYGSIDVFTAKLDPSGNFLWAKKGTAHDTDRGIDLACDPSGNIYVTGQFTDTITFDIAHPNNMYNAIFLIKYDAAGNEQWFRTIGGATMNVVTGIATDNGSGIYLTGNFTGNLIFFGTPSVTLTHSYPNRIFIAKYDNSGNLIWKEADGSLSEIYSANITVDNSGSPSVVGWFKCRLNEYADQYGQGIFNSIGYEDIFVTKYDNTGAWLFSRHYGNKLDDYGRGICVNSTGALTITGSFKENLTMPTEPGLLGYNAVYFGGGMTYCGDTDYQLMYTFPSAGSADILITNNIDPLNEPLDYYFRDGSGCAKPYVGVCIDEGWTSTELCPDTLRVCSSPIIGALANVFGGAGPDFNYLWSTGSVFPLLTVTSSGDYWIQQTSVDGCFVSWDTINVIISTPPPTPTITDDEGININAITTDSVVVCGDSVLLTGGNYLPNTCFWEYMATPTFSSTILADSSGVYLFTAVDTLTGCTSSNYVIVEIDEPLPLIVPEMYSLQDTLNNDSIRICEGDEFAMYIYDTITNPSGALTCITDMIVYWSVSPGTISYVTATDCEGTWTDTYNLFYPDSSGLYTITALMVRNNSCGMDTTIIVRDIYVTIDPKPVVTYTGSTFLCPGDSAFLVASGALNYYWSAWFNTSFYWENDTLILADPDEYYIVGENEFGCFGSTTFTLSLKPQPVVSPANGLICPNDSIQLDCTGSGSFVWYGPSGILPSSTSSVYVSTNGYYYCIVTDPDSCEQISNTVFVSEYTTPFLLASPSAVICPGDSLQLSAITNAGSLLSWQSPLSGSDTVQYVTSPGTYTCEITSCGILTLASITVTLSSVSASINVSGPLSFCYGDSVLLSGNPGMTSYLWQPGSITLSSIYASEPGTYYLTTTDVYGCTADADPVIVNTTPNTLPLPTAENMIICTGNSVTLSASGQGLLYWFEVPFGWSPTDSGSLFTTPILTSTTTYYLAAADSGCKSSMSPVTVTVDDCDDPIIPNVFSPDGDGINDLFGFDISSTSCFDCVIYDRWGILMSRWTDASGGWDGTAMGTGRPASEGVYYFLLTYCDQQNEQKQASGFLHLIRNP